MNKPKKQTQAEKQDETRRLDELKAKYANSALFSNAALMTDFGKSSFGEIDVHLLHEELKNSIGAIHSGELKHLESMLVGQAKALQTMFVNLAMKANRQEYVKNFNTFMNLALKSQSQSRATIQALVELKYPRQVVVTQQANFSNGHQQVNNGATQEGFQSSTHAHAPTHAGKNQNEPNKLMESSHENNQSIENQPQRLDNRTTQTAVTSDTPLETVATVNRRKNA